MPRRLSEAVIRRQPERTAIPGFLNFTSALIGARLLFGCIEILHCNGSDTHTRTKGEDDQQGDNTHRCIIAKTLKELGQLLDWIPLRSLPLTVA